MSSDDSSTKSPVIDDGPAVAGAGAEAIDYSPSAKLILEKILENQRSNADGFRLSLWANLYSTPVLAEIQRSHGLLRDDINILFCLAHYDQLTSTSISSVVGRPKNSISRGVERLLQKELIRGRQVEEDRRHTMLSIEPAGRQLAEHITAMFEARATAMLRVLSPVERVALDQILTKLMAAADI